VPLAGKSRKSDEKENTARATGILLRLKDRLPESSSASASIPIEADCICPDLFAGRSLEEIKSLPVFYGRRKMALSDLFAVESVGQGGDSSPPHIIVQGDLAHVKKIGHRMTQGRITVRGTAGLHLGAFMSGGEIVVEGNAGDWAGAHMQGGRIWIKGNAGHLLGAAYRGEKSGVNRGEIIVEGNAGREVGAQMRRGLIVVMGDAGDFSGARMVAGSLFVFGCLGARAGAGMKRGTIVACGDHGDLLPTFRYACRYQPVFLRQYLLRLRAWGLPIGDEYLEGSYQRYHGDFSTLGKGEILIYDQRK
jgi:formylmethanofuran dehydrogenase subunit C